jgi:hypothetical protein
MKSKTKGNPIRIKTKTKKNKQKNYQKKTKNSILNFPVQTKPILNNGHSKTIKEEIRVSQRAKICERVKEISATFQSIGSGIQVSSRLPKKHRKYRISNPEIKNNRLF